MIHKLFRQSSVIVHIALSAGLWEVCDSCMRMLWMCIFYDICMALQVKCHQWIFKNLWFVFIFWLFFNSFHQVDLTLFCLHMPDLYTRVQHRDFCCRHTRSGRTFHNPWSRLAFRKPSYTLNMTGWCFGFCVFLYLIWAWIS